MLEVPPSESVTFSVDYWGPSLVAADRTHGVDSYHLVYILDVDASQYIGTLQSIPDRDQNVVRTTAARVTFDHVVPGSHALTVLLAGSNDVSVNPPVAARSLLGSGDPVQPGDGYWPTTVSVATMPCCSWPAMGQISW